MKRLLMIFIVLTLVSCSKQEAPSIDNGEIRTQAEMTRLEACTQTNFNKGVLLYHNVLSLFVCTKWNEEFPKMLLATQQVLTELSHANPDFFSETFMIEDGERIAQMVIARHEQAVWQEVDVLDETERGAGGFGHTGV